MPGKVNIAMSIEARDNANGTYRFNIEFYIYRENDRLIAYCPSLDLATSGDNYNDAVANFYECFQLYVESCIEAGTLFDDLKQHGWKVTKNTIKPPTFTQQLRNAEFKALLNSGIGYEKVVNPAHIAVC